MGLFTDHVRQFDPKPQGPDAKRSWGGQNVSNEQTLQVLKVLGRALEKCIAVRGLLSVWPKFLDCHVAAGTRPSACDELIHDCYEFAILDRIVGLQNQLAGKTKSKEKKDNIDGIVFRNIDTFVGELQGRHDPIGYAAYNNLCVAVQQAKDDGWLKIETFNPDGAASSRRRRKNRPENKTRLTLARRRGAAHAATTDQIRELLERAPNWLEVLPQMRRTTVAAQAWLSDFLKELQQAGICSLRFGDLKDVLTERIRDDSPMHREKTGDGGDEKSLANVADTILPGKHLRDGESLDDFVQQLLHRIKKLDKHSKVVKRLARIVKMLAKEVESGEIDNLTYADLGRKLRIKPQTLSDDFRLLREIFRGSP
jgi:hypothetical protein